MAAALGAILVLAWFFIRQRVLQYRAIGARIEGIKQKLLEHPDVEHYFDQNEHLGDLLIATNRRREALGVFETYLELEKQAGRELPKLEAKIAKLKTHLDELN